MSNISIGRFRKGLPISLEYYMYDDIGEEITMDDFNRAKECLRKANSVPYCVVNDWDPVPLDCCDAPVKLDPEMSGYSYTPKKKKDNNMRASYYNDSVSAPSASVNITAPEGFNSEKTAQDRLISRARDAFREKGREMEKTYHLYDENEPTTIKEMLERVKAGDYKFDSNYKEDFILSREFDRYGNMFHYFDWRKDAADRAGYDKAYALLDKAHDELVDTITVLGAKEGLAALRAFEAQSFSIN